MYCNLHMKYISLRNVYLTIVEIKMRLFQLLSICIWKKCVGMCYFFQNLKLLLHYWTPKCNLNFTVSLIHQIFKCKNRTKIWTVDTSLWWTTIDCNEAVDENKRKSSPNRISFFSISIPSLLTADVERLFDALCFRNRTSSLPFWATLLTDYAMMAVVSLKDRKKKPKPLSRNGMTAERAF